MSTLFLNRVRSTLSLTTSRSKCKRSSRFLTTTADFGKCHRSCAMSLVQGQNAVKHVCLSKTRTETRTTQWVHTSVRLTSWVITLSTSGTSKDKRQCNSFQLISRCWNKSCLTSDQSSWLTSWTTWRRMRRTIWTHWLMKWGTQCLTWFKIQQSWSSWRRTDRGMLRSEAQGKHNSKPDSTQ